MSSRFLSPLTFDLPVKVDWIKTFRNLENIIPEEISVTPGQRCAYRLMLAARVFYQLK